MANVDKMSTKQIAHGVSATLSGTTPASGNVVDTAGFEALTYAFQTGTVTDAGATAGFSMKLQHSDTTVGGDFTDCAAGDMVGGTQTLSVTADGDDSVAVGMLGYIGIKRYVRTVVTGTSGTNAVINGIAILERGRYAPETAIAANITAS